GLTLLAVTESTSCQNPPARLQAIYGTNPTLWQPRFSPDGRRIVYVESSDGKIFYASVVGFDGTEYRRISPFCSAAGDGGTDTSCWGTEFGPVRPQWLNSGTVAWVRAVSAGTDLGYPAGFNIRAYDWEIVTAADSAASQISVYMKCNTPYTPSTIGFLP